MGKELLTDLKYAIFKNWLGTRSKMETNEPNVYPTIFGGVSRGFWSPFKVWALEVPFLALENGHFCQSTKYTKKHEFLFNPSPCNLIV